MNRKKIFALFAIAFAVALLVMAPASLVGAWMGSLTRGTVELANSEGTVWSGSGIPVFYLPRGTPVTLDQISWKISVRALLQGKIHLMLSQGRAPERPAAVVDAGPGSITLRDVSVEVPAEVLEEIHPLLQALQPHGTLQITSGRLTLSRESMQGTASAQWLSASSAVTTVNPVGSYQFNVRCTGAQAAIDLTTLSGPLMLDGHGEWSSAAGLTIEAHARTNPENQASLAELLHHLGPEISPGVRLVRIGRAI